jgi:hypothetical protein
VWLAYRITYVNTDGADVLRFDTANLDVMTQRTENKTTWRLFLEWFCSLSVVFVASRYTTCMCWVRGARRADTHTHTHTHTNTIQVAHDGVHLLVIATHALLTHAATYH